MVYYANCCYNYQCCYPGYNNGYQSNLCCPPKCCKPKCCYTICVVDKTTTTDTVIDKLAVETTSCCSNGSTTVTTCSTQLGATPPTFPISSKINCNTFNLVITAVPGGADTKTDYIAFAPSAITVTGPNTGISVSGTYDACTKTWAVTLT